MPVRACVSLRFSLTSSTVDTVLRQSLILDWKLDVPGEDRSSLVRTTKSEILIRSGMFRAKRREAKATSDNQWRAKCAEV